ncbi:MAG: hypothetical protein ACI87E_005079 [Mariniblastus sp.]|jgi:hypothetical protein
MKSNSLIHFSSHSDLKQSGWLIEYEVKRQAMVTRTRKF